MKVEINLKEETSIPKYQTAGACGFDFAAHRKTIIKAKSTGLVPTGCVIKVPQGYALLVGSRSSTAKKFGLLTPHGFGLIDQDYHGENDEIMLQFYNITDSDVVVEKGERVGQGFFVRCDQAQFEISQQPLREDNRGGFGSTKH